LGKSAPVKTVTGRGRYARLVIPVILATCVPETGAQPCATAGVWPEKIELKLHPIGATGCVMSSVLDENGNPIVNAQVKAVARDPAAIAGWNYPALNGRAMCKTLSPGSYSVSFSEKGFGSSEDRAFYPDGPQEISVPAGGCVEVMERLARTASLVLKGRDAVTGEPFAPHLLQASDLVLGERLMKGGLTLGVEFGRSFAFRKDATVQAGKALEVPSQGELYLRVGTDGYEPTEFRIPALQPAETREFEFALLPVVPGCLEGIVVDDQNRRATGASVYLAPRSPFQLGGRSGQTGVDGKFKVEGVNPGSYVVWVEKKSEGYVEDWEDKPEVIIASSSQCEEMNVTLPPKAAWVLVHLVNGKTQLPTSGNIVLTDPETGRRRSHYIREKEPIPVAVPPNTPMTIMVSSRGRVKPAEPTQIPALQSGQILEVTFPLP
jgi:hypothetical protein